MTFLLPASKNGNIQTLHLPTHSGQGVPSLHMQIKSHNCTEIKCHATGRDARLVTALDYAKLELGYQLCVISTASIRKQSARHVLRYLCKTVSTIKHLLNCGFRLHRETSVQINTVQPDPKKKDTERSGVEGPSSCSDLSNGICVPGNMSQRQDPSPRSFQSKFKPWMSKDDARDECEPKQPAT